MKKTIDERIQFLMDNPKLGSESCKTSFVEKYIKDRSTNYSNCAGTALWCLDAYDFDRPLYFNPYLLSSFLQSHFRYNSNGSLLAFKNSSSTYYDHFAINLGDGNMFMQRRNTAPFEVENIRDFMHQTSGGATDNICVMHSYNLMRPLHLEVKNNEIVQDLEFGL